MMFVFEGYPNLWTKETPATVAEWAKSQPRNEYHFVQTAVNPPKGTYVMVDDKGKTHQWDVEINQFEPFGDVVELGYKWYVEDMQKCNRATTIISKKAWEKQHETIYTKINEEIAQHHGIQCFLNGRNDLDDPKNNVVLHFCDALVIAMRKMKDQEPPKVMIKSEHFKVLKPSTTYRFFPSDDLLPQGLTSEERFFVFLNADIFYHMYGLWGNHSNKPIRVENKDVLGLERSAAFSNHPSFIGHQLGKYKQLKRCVHNELAKYLYICH